MQIWRALTRPSYRYLKISSGFYFLKKSNYKKKALRESHLNERCIGMAGEGEGNSVIVLQRRTPFGEEKRFRTRPNSFTKLSQYYIWFSFRDGCWISILFRSRHLFVLFFFQQDSYRTHSVLSFSCSNCFTFYYRLTLSTIMENQVL